MDRYQFLADIRKKRGLSQNDIASFLGYSAQLVSLWEKGKVSPDLAIISKYSDILSLDLEGFINCKDQKNNNLCKEKRFDSKQFSTFIKGLRKSKNLLQGELAKKLGTNNKSISAWENMFSLPSIDQFVSLSVIFGLSYDELYFCFIDETKKVEPTRKKRVFIPIIFPIIFVVSLGGAGAGIGIAISRNNRRKPEVHSSLDSIDITSDVSIFSEDMSSDSFISSETDASLSEDITSIDSSSEIVEESSVEITSEDISSEDTNSEEDVIPGVSLYIDLGNMSATYGFYPQSIVTDPYLIDKVYYDGDVKENGWYFYNEEYYLKDSGRWFKCEPIKWKILSHDGDDYFLVSDKILDAKAFYHSLEERVVSSMTIYPSNYEYSDIRTWLNTSFYDTAFSMNAENIKSTLVNNSKKTTNNPSNNLYVCNDTNDKVFLLSYADYNRIAYGFFDNDDRKSQLTDWAVHQDAFNDEGYGYYWTRSPDDVDSSLPWCVQQSGSLYKTYGGDATTTNCGVRPAITVTTKKP